MGGHGSEKQRLPRRPGEEPWSLVAGFALVISVGEDEKSGMKFRVKVKHPKVH